MDGVAATVTARKKAHGINNHTGREKAYLVRWLLQAGKWRSYDDLSR